MCRLCLAPRRLHSPLSRQALYECPGYSVKLARIVSNPRGHLLTARDCTEQPPILLCFACPRWTETGTHGLLSQQDEACPADRGKERQANGLHKKYKYLHNTVFAKRHPPNPNRAEAGERVHAVIGLTDDPRVTRKLRYYQEHFEVQRADDIHRLLGAPSAAASSSDLPSPLPPVPGVRVSPSARSR